VELPPEDELAAALLEHADRKALNGHGCALQRSHARWGTGYREGQQGDRDAADG
jgi:hypothetical protein